MLSLLTKWFLKDISALLAFIRNLEDPIAAVIAKGHKDIQVEIDRITIVKASAKEVEMHLQDLIQSACLGAAIEEEYFLDNVRAIETGIAHLMHIKSNIAPSAVAPVAAPVSDTAPSSTNTDA